MKTVLISIAGTAITYFALAFFLATPDYVTSKRFEEAHAEVTAKIDSVKATLDSAYFKINVLDTKIDRVQSEIGDIKATADTLKAGQKAIYYEVRKTATKSFSDRVLDFLNF